MITVFAYRAIQWKNGKPLEATAPAIGFTDTVPNHGTTIGIIKPSAKSGTHYFFLEVKPRKVGLSATSLRTITDKLDSLNAKAIPTKKGTGNIRYEKAQALRKKASNPQRGD